MTTIAQTDLWYGTYTYLGSLNVMSELPKENEILNKHGTEKVNFLMCNSFIYLFSVKRGS